MEYLYCPDWEEKKQRYLQWWNMEDFGRCGLWVTAPKRGCEHPAPLRKPKTPYEKWADHAYLHDRNEYEMQNTFYGGEAIPMWTAGHVGLATISTLLGCKLTLDMNTGWHDPIWGDYDSLEKHDYHELKVDFDGPLFRQAMDLHSFAAEDAAGKSFPQINAFGHTGDVLAGIRGTQQLLYDVADSPEYVHEIEMYLIELWNEVYTRYFNAITKGCDGGSVTWFCMWAPGRFYIPSNDFTYMISPKMYRDIFLDALERNLEMLDYSLYHVDGIGAFNHVDMLCELPRLNALQILPGDGKPSPLYYMDVLKKVQAAGKGLHITIPAKEVPEALENLSSKGLFIATHCSSQDEAEALIRYAEKYSRYY